MAGVTKAELQSAIGQAAAFLGEQPASNGSFDPYCGLRNVERRLRDEGLDRETPDQQKRIAELEAEVAALKAKAEPSAPEDVESYGSRGRTEAWFAVAGLIEKMGCNFGEIDDRSGTEKATDFIKALAAERDDLKRRLDEERERAESHRHAAKAASERADKAEGRLHEVHVVLEETKSLKCVMEARLKGSLVEQERLQNKAFLATTGRGQLLREIDALRTELGESKRQLKAVRDLLARRDEEIARLKAQDITILAGVVEGPLLAMQWVADDNGKYGGKGRWMARVHVGGERPLGTIANAGPISVQSSPDGGHAYAESPNFDAR